jgi:hypothetical protein
MVRRMDMDEKTPGQVAFEAYNESKGGLTYDGKPIPPWSSLEGDTGDAVKRGWEAASTAVLRACGVTLRADISDAVLAEMAEVRRSIEAGEYIVVAITQAPWDAARVVVMDKAAHDTLVRGLPGFVNLKSGMESSTEAREWYAANRERLGLGITLPLWCEETTIRGVKP